jgi:MFS transporter, SP family, sugar:H+ symporter
MSVEKSRALSATADTSRIEAPVTTKAYFMCAFAAFGGIFFGYDSGYINGVLGMKYFITLHTNLSPSLLDDENTKDDFTLSASRKSLIVSILSAGTFFGAIIAGDIADFTGRRTTVIIGCIIFTVGVILQTASAEGLGLIVAGRLIAGFGVGFVSAIIILYMSEIAPKRIRGAIVSGYQFCITVGILLASCVTYGTEDRDDSGSYRIPIAIQMLWALILGMSISCCGGGGGGSVHLLSLIILQAVVSSCSPNPRDTSSSVAILSALPTS